MMYIISSPDFKEYMQTSIACKLEAKTKVYPAYKNVVVEPIDEETLELALLLQKLIRKPVEDLREDLIGLSNLLTSIVHK